MKKCDDPTVFASSLSNPKQPRNNYGQQNLHLPDHPGQRPGGSDDAQAALGGLGSVEERVEQGADHHALGRLGQEAVADGGQDQRQSRGDAAEVPLCLTRQQLKWLLIFQARVHQNEPRHTFFNT